MLNSASVDDAHTTRRVLWTEPVDHLKKPLGNAVYALQGHKDNEGDDYEDDDDEDEEADEKTEGSFSRACGSDFGAVHSPKGKGLARPARPSRSTAKNMSYAEDEDDVFDNGGSVMESDIEDDMDDEDQDGDKVSRFPASKSFRRPDLLTGLDYRSSASAMARSLLPVPLTTNVTVVPRVVGLAVVVMVSALEVSLPSAITITPRLLGAVAWVPTTCLHMA